MNLSATEKRIYALAQKWARSRYKPSPANGNSQRNYGRTDQRKECGRALLKLFKERD